MMFVQDYFDIIKTPMDMGTIRTRLERGAYGSVDECLRDFDLMFSNCYTYNKPNTDITKMCQALQRAYYQRLAAMPQPVRTADTWPPCHNRYVQPTPGRHVPTGTYSRRLATMSQPVRTISA